MVIISEGLEFIERQQHPQHPERSSTIKSANPQTVQTPKTRMCAPFPSCRLELAYGANSNGAGSQSFACHRFDGSVKTGVAGWRPPVLR
jgi:hypothetical protein